MIGGESFTIALRGIMANKLRSALTMLGILIGVGAVIVLVAVGNGSSKAVQNRIDSLGTNTITIMKGFTQGRRRSGRNRDPEPTLSPHRRRRPGPAGPDPGA